MHRVGLSSAIRSCLRATLPARRQRVVESTVAGLRPWQHALRSPRQLYFTRFHSAGPPAQGPDEGHTALGQDQNGNEEQTTPLTDREDDAAAAAERKAQLEAMKKEQPSYQLTFTCAKCMERSSHRISKQGYHHGTILITCPGCKNKHLISDHLKIFSDRNVTLEDIMKEKGEMLKKGVLGADGDVEFYPEATENAIYIKNRPFFAQADQKKKKEDR